MSDLDKILDRVRSEARMTLDIAFIRRKIPEVKWSWDASSRTYLGSDGSYIMRVSATYDDQSEPSRLCRYFRGTKSPEFIF